LYLESSRFLGSGKRVSLRFAPTGTLKVRGGAPGVKGFGVFPGCLVCVKGKNGGGGVFVVEEVLMVSRDFGFGLKFHCTLLAIPAFGGSD
jgi:DNA polymerase alpha subunit B